MRSLPELTEMLETIPNRIAESRRTLGVAKATQTAAKNHLDDRVADEIAMVSGEIDDKGKPKYGNKEAREQAARKALLADPQWVRLTGDLERAEIATQNAQIQLNLLEEESRVLYAQLDAAVAVLRAEAIQELTKATLALARYEAGRKETL